MPSIEVTVRLFARLIRLKRFALRSIRGFESFGADLFSGQSGEPMICPMVNIMHKISGYWIFWNNGIYRKSS
jgi:hypothetical protein